MSIIICDKSFLECLKKEESLLFNRYFFQNITPVIFLEILADLKQQPRTAETPEQRVSRLAQRLPKIKSGVSAYYLDLCRGEINHGAFHGQPVPLGPHVIPAIKPKIIRNNKDQLSCVYDEPPLEQVALDRCRSGMYTEFEQIMAERWHATEKSLDLASYAEDLKKKFITLPNFTDAGEALEFVDDLLVRLQNKPVLLYTYILQHFDIPDHKIQEFMYFWSQKCIKEKRSYPPEILIPYSYWVFRVELFYKVALSKGVVENSNHSKSHIDLQYLFYLPFCQTFVSNDSFHQKTVPLLKRSDQMFVWGQDLKKDLKAINEHIMQLGTEEQERALYSHYPPEIDNSLMCAIKDFHHKGWRKQANNQSDLERSADADKNLVDMLTAATKGKELHNNENRNADIEVMAVKHELTQQEILDYFGPKALAKINSKEA